MRAIVRIVAVAVMCVLAAGAPPTVAADPAGLHDEVTARIVDLAKRKAPRTQVTVLRAAADEWAFGAAVALAPAEPDAYPEGWLFVAHRAKGVWSVAFEGDATFPALTAAAPSPVLSSAEKAIFASHGAPTDAVLVKATTSTDASRLVDADFRTGLRLPYAVGQSWRLTGGPHGTARQSIDLAGGDGRVLAAGAGTFYVMCGSGRGWVRVVHDRGYATDYYHLRNNRTATGPVAEGTFLGDTGTDVSCGGSATGPHNHFSLRQNGINVGIAAHNLGKWQPYNGPSQYQGYALHGSTRVNVGGSLYNHGALGLTEAIVDTNGGGVVNRRAGPGTGFAVLGTMPDGATVPVSCSAAGTTHTGRFGYTTDLWNRLDDGSWISDAFSWTGTATPVNGWCAAPAVPGPSEPGPSEPGRAEPGPSASESGGT